MGESVIRSYLNNDVFSISPMDAHWYFAMRLFQITGHTTHKEPMAINNKIKDFVYFDISRKQILRPNDWRTLSYITSASLLFSNNGAFWDLPVHYGGIDYYSMELMTSKHNRSQIACDVHRVFSRITPSAFSVILFESQNEYILSFAKRCESKNGVLLSDWFSANEFIETDLVERVNVACFSSNNIEDFFLDFEYSVARDYYLHPISHEYAAYEMFPINLQITDGAVDRETINEIVRENYLSVVHEYEDDYVESESDNQDHQEISIDDFSMSLIELKIDEDKTTPNIEIDDKEDFGEDDNEEDSSNDNSYDYLDEIDDDIFSNPSKLLSWLES